MKWHQILGFLCFLYFLHSHLPFASSLCPPDQRDTLLHFQKSFILEIKGIAADGQTAVHGVVVALGLPGCTRYKRGGWDAEQCLPPYERGERAWDKSVAWNESVDCCLWKGVTCDNVTGAPYENTVTVMMKGKETKLVKILTIFTTIDLSCNFFQGDIPEAFGHLHSLIGLNLSHNHLTSSIPPTLGNLNKLEWLDLSSNKLRGGIPRVLGDLTFLGYLNLSKNQLTGRIPQDKQLSTFSSDSFGGNRDLCGTPLPRACPGDAQPPPPSSSSTLDCEGHESWFKHKEVWIGYASGTIIGISIAYIAIEIGRPKWLMRGVRMLERSAAKWMEKPKRKAIKFHGQ